MRNILLIEDDPDVATVTVKRLSGAGYHVEHCVDGLQLLMHLVSRTPPPDAIVLDMGLPGRSGYELLNAIRVKAPACRIFVFTAHGEYEHMIPKEAVSAFVLKTEGIDRLLAVMSEGLADRVR